MNRSASRRPARRPAFHSPAAGLLLAAASLAAGCSPGEAPVPEPRLDPRPRVVMLIVLDTLAAGHVGHLGYERETTPAIDALARDGISFTQAISSAAYTVASIPSILTGRLPDRHGVTWYDYRLAEEEETLAELLRAGQYRTTALLGMPTGGVRYGNGQGFEEVVQVWEGAGPSGSETRRNKDGTLTHLPEPHEFPLLVRERLDRLGAQERLFLYLHLLQPHGPYRPPQAYAERLEPRGYEGGFSGQDRQRLGRAMRTHRDTQRTRDGVRHLYDANIAWVDESVGQILDDLRARDLYDDSLILLTSDHGEAFWQHGRHGHSEHLYEEYLRVPLVVKLPEGQGPVGLEISALVSSIDLVPSLCDWLGLPRPELELDGRSVLPLIEDPSERSAHAALLVRAAEGERRFGLRLPQGKLIVTYDEAKARGEDPAAADLQLFDLARDPLEQQDQADTRPNAARGLLEHLEDLLAELDRRAPTEIGAGPGPDKKMLEALGYVGEDGELR